MLTFKIMPNFASPVIYTSCSTSKGKPVFVCLHSGWVENEKLKGIQIARRGY